MSNAQSALNNAEFALRKALSDRDEPKTKSERRDDRKRNKRKMKVSGAGNRVLQGIIVDRAKRLNDKSS